MFFTASVPVRNTPLPPCVRHQALAVIAPSQSLPEIKDFFNFFLPEQWRDLHTVLYPVLFHHWATGVNSSVWELMFKTIRESVCLLLIRDSQTASWNSVGSLSTFQVTGFRWIKERVVSSWRSLLATHTPTHAVSTKSPKFKSGYFGVANQNCVFFFSVYPQVFSVFQPALPGASDEGNKLCQLQWYIFFFISAFLLVVGR